MRFTKSPHDKGLPFVLNDVEAESTQDAAPVVVVITEREVLVIVVVEVCEVDAAANRHEFEAKQC